jgi:hypothetical protein
MVIWYNFNPFWYVEKRKIWQPCTEEEKYFKPLIFQKFSGTKLSMALYRSTTKPSVGNWQLP